MAEDNTELVSKRQQTSPEVLPEMMDKEIPGITSLHEKSSRFSFKAMGQDFTLEFERYQESDYINSKDNSLWAKFLRAIRFKKAKKAEELLIATVSDTAEKPIGWSVFHTHRSDKGELVANATELELHDYPDYFLNHASQPIQRLCKTLGFWNFKLWKNQDAVFLNSKYHGSNIGGVMLACMNTALKLSSCERVIINSDETANSKVAKDIHQYRSFYLSPGQGGTILANSPNFYEAMSDELCTVYKPMLTQKDVALLKKQSFQIISN